ncbi:phosphoenolpyruvate--protein phosphotransferase [Paracoccus versutus]|uniref:phosphoenolpyruvate--protein phosphotransferase n=1 Tax=Paracoccus versutus TaxID=34007 RepID=UPI001FB58381|nr:phosphoenolpyruvate--protein phosphotransferase [Paracoccus versutus]MCJ1901378.1 phosphoenolpyruvate--protein phosphotransferase [Paracoccus versutus]
MIERSFVVRVHDGLHARPATQFVKLAKSFVSEIQITCNAQSASAKSAVKLMLLGIKENDEATLRVEGEDEAEALSALATFLQTPTAGDVALKKSNELASPASTPDPAPMASPSKRAGWGIAASEGTALGPVFAFFPPVLKIEPHRVEDTNAEVTRFAEAVDSVTSVFARNKERPEISADAIGIIDALIDLAHDTDFADEVGVAIRTGQDAASAALAVGTRLTESFEAMEDPYIRARAEDMRSVTRQIVLALLGQRDVSLDELSHGSIIVADEVTAWDLAKARLSDVAGIVCRKGAATSHVAIMARAYGIPAVLGAAVSEEQLKSAQIIGLDGATGQVFVDPDAETRMSLTQAIERETADRKALEAYRAIEPVTSDGRRIEVAANLGTLAEIPSALEAGAMGVGLFRTEFLFMERKTLPSEDEQAETYRKLAEAFAPYPVVIRTLDIGGDKPIAGVDFEHEDNPFLGWRGVRMCLERTDVFKPQLRALLRASVVGNVKVLLPMIADGSEVEAVRDLFAQCQEELEREGTLYGTFELGVMIETPAAVFLADDLAQKVDFFSVGTNDLTQYVMAADRLNPKVANLNRTEHPAVLAAIAAACKAAREAGIWIGVCGEAAARPDLISFFVENGVTELSMSSAAIPRAKRCVTEL